MARGDRSLHDGNAAAVKGRPHSTKARFVRWGIADARGGNPYTVIDLEPVMVQVTLEVVTPLKDAMHGIALYTHEQQLIWALTPRKMHLGAGEHQLCHAFPMLPLRPGAYNWLVSLYDEGELVDLWNCLPEMIVAAESHQSSYDEWTGVLNIPDSFRVVSGATASQPVDEPALEK
jgi:hypothetical protein